MRRDEAWEAFPRQHARTRRFTLGEPRGFRVAPDGRRVAFLRSRAGDDPVHALWVLDLPSGVERCVVDPRDLEVDDADLPPEERARRERARESGAGIVAYTVDRAVARAAFALGGRLFVADLVGGGALELPVTGPVVSPLLSPTGAAVAFVRDRALAVVDVGSGAEHPLAGEDEADVTWGLAEFIAAEEMGRQAGMWWSPDGTRILAARVDTSPVVRWHITDPSQPAAAPTAVAYPAAGTANAEVTLAVLSLDGARVDVAWDRTDRPYLARAGWSEAGPYAAVQSRDQRAVDVLAVDAVTGRCTVVARQRDPVWVELVDGVPQRLDDGRVLATVDDEETRRLTLDGAPLTPPGLQVRRVAAVDGDAALVTASADDPTAVGLWRVPLSGASPEQLSSSEGVHDGAAAGDVTVVVCRSLHAGASVEVRHPGGSTAVAGHGEEPVLRPRVELLRLGERQLAAALLLPRGHAAAPSDAPLPVLLDPYGGPHAQRVLQAQAAFGTSQWFADAGYAVVVVDGRGTPGRGPAWERAIAGDLAGPPLEDQLDALEALARERPGLLDLDRVAIRGWSFGGYLAALAVLRRPDAVHAAVAGAPVTDWRLYDTHYTERYLGRPDEAPDAYERASLLPSAGHPHPGVPERPLLLIHGLADDNVVAAHTLQLSRALLEAGRPHNVLPLLGVTHMTPQEVVAENLLRLQLHFLDEALRPGQ